MESYFNEIASGIGGAGGTGAILIYMIRRMINANESKNKEQSQKIDELTKSVGKLQISVSVLNTQVENLTKAVDRINRLGCQHHGERDL